MKTLKYLLPVIFAVSICVPSAAMDNGESTATSYGRHFGAGIIGLGVSAYLANKLGLTSWQGLSFAGLSLGLGAYSAYNMHTAGELAEEQPIEATTTRLRNTFFKGAAESIAYLGTLAGAFIVVDKLRS